LQRGLNGLQSRLQTAVQKSVAKIDLQSSKDTLVSLVDDLEIRMAVLFGQTLEEPFLFVLGQTFGRNDPDVLFFIL
jgi:hypothetical protein